MLRRTRTWTIGLLAIACLLPGAASAVTHTLTFDAVPVTECEEHWIENALGCHFTDTTDEDLYEPGFCLLMNPTIDVDGNLGPYFGPGRLVVDMTNIQNVDTVEADVYEAHGAGGTQMFLYGWTAEGQIDYDNILDNDQTWNTGHYTLGLVPGAGTPVAALVISAWESAVWEIRFIGDGIVEGEPNVTFGALKALYR